VHVTIYRGATNPTPIAQDTFPTWSELADEIEAMTDAPPLAPASADRETQKRSMLAFGPHRLSAPHRNAANVEAVTLLVIDVDTLPDLGALLERCAALGDPCMVYASPSDTPEARRVRVVAPISREIHPDDCKRTRQAFAELLGVGPGQGVEGAIEAAKLFFVGRLHGTPPRDVWRFGE
jgi:hypothetical protein